MSLVAGPSALAGAIAALVVANLVAFLPAWRAARFRATDWAERA